MKVLVIVCSGCKGRKKKKKQLTLLNHLPDPSLD